MRRRGRFESNLEVSQVPILRISKLLCRDGFKTYHKINLMTMSVNQAPGSQRIEYRNIFATTSVVNMNSKNWLLQASSV